MEHRRRSRLSLLGLPLAGLGSALVTLRIPLGVLEHVNVLGSLTFGIFVSAWFWAFLGCRAIGKTLGFIGMSPIAAVLAVWAAVVINGRFGIANPDDLRLYFIGGYVGAFFLTAAAPLVANVRVRFPSAVLQGLLWATAGGVLAVVGRAAGGSFRGYWRRLDPNQPEPDTSLIFLWHIGMALVLGVEVWIKKSNSRAGAV